MIARDRAAMESECRINVGDISEFFRDASQDAFSAAVITRRNVQR